MADLWSPAEVSARTKVKITAWVLSTGTRLPLPALYQEVAWLCASGEAACGASGEAGWSQLDLISQIRSVRGTR